MNGEESILDLILEKTSNTEASINKLDINQYLNEQLKLMSRRERRTRESTITFELKNDTNGEALINKIEGVWLKEMNGASVSFWQSKEKLYAEFNSKESRNAFIEEIMKDRNKHATIINAMANAHGDGNFYKRLPVKYEIANVRQTFKGKIIESSIRQSVGSRAEISDFKEGEPSGPANKRGIYFKTNDIGCFEITWIQDATIGYTHIAMGIRKKLLARICARPYMCKDCHQIGRHQCEGRVCAKCGNKGHMSKECKNKTKYCVNCKRKGHKARDLHCPTYLNETIKELRKMDISLSFYEKEDERYVLIKNLQLK